MLRDAEPQAVFLGHLLPHAHDVPLRTEFHGVPAMVGRVPQVEVVVMDAHAHEVLGACLGVHRHEPIGVPVLGLPQRNDLFVAVLARMAVVLQVMLVVAVARLVHAPGVPVAVQRHRLRSPVGPDAELGVAEPLGTLVLLEGFPLAGKRPRCNLHLLRHRRGRRRILGRLRRTTSHRSPTPHQHNQETPSVHANSPLNNRRFLNIDSLNPDAKPLPWKPTTRPAGDRQAVAGKACRTTTNAAWWDRRPSWPCRRRNRCRCTRSN